MCETNFDLLAELKKLWLYGPERVGLVLDDNCIIELDNIDPDPYNAFSVTTEQFDKYQGRIVATWHTHPKTSANLSVEDYHCFRAWPDWFHYIVAEDEIRCYYTKEQIVYLVDDEENNTPRLPEGPAS